MNLKKELFIFMFVALALPKGGCILWRKGCFRSNDVTTQINSLDSPKSCTLFCHLNRQLYAAWKRELPNCLCLNYSSPLQSCGCSKPHCAVLYYTNVSIIKDISLESSVISQNQPIVINIKVNTKPSQEILKSIQVFLDNTEVSFQISNENLIDFNILVNTTLLEFGDHAGKIILKDDVTEIFINDYSFKKVKGQLLYFTVKDDDAKIVQNGSIAVKSNTCLKLCFWAEDQFSYLTIQITPNVALNETFLLKRAEKYCSCRLVIEIPFKKAGIYSLAAIAQQTNQSYFTKLERVVIVQDKIQFLCVKDINFFIGKQNTHRAVYVGPSTGVTFLWYFGNGTDPKITDKPECNYTSTQSLGFNLVIVAKNDVSTISTERTIHLLYQPKNVKINAPPNPILEGKEVVFSTNMLFDGNTKFSWSIEISKKRVLKVSQETRFKVVLDIIGKAEIQLQVLSPLANKNITHVLYIIKKIEPFPAFYSHITCTVIKFSVNLDVDDYYADFFNSTYNPSFTWNFGDGSKEVQTEKPYVNHDYGGKCGNTLRAYNASVIASNVLSSYMTNTHVFIQKDICNIQIYFPWRYGIVKQFKLSDHITFLPVVDVNCSIHVTASYLWQYSDATLSQVSNKTLSNKLSFTIPANSPKLGVGTFKYTFQISTSIGITRSYQGTFRIIRSGLKANIRSGGVRYINNDPSFMIELDGSKSYDIDHPGSASGLSYKWDCYVQDGKEENKCFQPGFKINLNTNKLKFPVKRLLNKSKIIFVLTVSKEKLASSNDTVLLLNSNISKTIHIECNSCRGHNQSSSTKSVFTAVCLNCDGDERFEWTIYGINTVGNLFSYYFKQCMPAKWPRQYLGGKMGTDVLARKKSTNNTLKNNCCRCKFNASTITEHICSTKIIQDKTCHIAGKETKRTNATLAPAVSQKTWIFGSASKLHTNAVPSTSRTYLKGVNPPDVDAYFTEDRKYRFKIENNAPHGLNKTVLVIHRDVFTPSFNYIVELNIYKTAYINQKKAVGRASFKFQVNQSPEKGSCEVMVLYGHELATKFTIKCKKWESEKPITYSMQIRVGNLTQQKLDKKYDIILSTRRHRFNFFLPFISDVEGYLNKKREVYVRVTVENSLGSRLVLCKLLIMLEKNSSIDDSYIFQRARSILAIRRFDNPSETMYELTMLTVKLNSLKPTEKTKETKQIICDLVETLAPEVSVLMLANWMKLLTWNLEEVKKSYVEVPQECMEKVIRVTRRIVEKPTYKCLFEHNGGHHNFVHDMHKVFLKILLFYKKNSNEIGKQKIVTMQKKFAANVAHAYYSDETYIYFTSLEMKAIGLKTSRTNVNIGRFVELNIQQNSIQRRDIETCYDVYAVTYTNIFNATVKENALSSDIMISDCSNKKKGRTPVTYHAHLPVQNDHVKLLLRWKEINRHDVNFTSYIDATHILINFYEICANHEHFFIDITLRNCNGSYIRKISYPQHCSSKACSIYFAEKTLNPGSYVLSLEIKSPHGKVVKQPWFNYTLSIATPHCESHTNFKPTKSCEVTALSTIDQIVCRCRGSALVSGYMTSIPHLMTVQTVNYRMFGSMIPVFSVCAAFFIYLLLVLWYWDVKSTFSETVSEHPENHPCDIYKYNILIETGYMSGAGTTARVCAVMHGTKGHSEKLELTNNNVDLFQRGATDMILISCPQHLGKLTHLNIWLNNQGTSPDWYIKQIIVKDMSTEEMSYFPFHNWFSLSRGVRQLSCRLVATEKSCHSIIQNVLEKFLDYHMWLSITVGPTKSSFSTFERLSCVMSSIVLYFVTAIVLFHGIIEQNDELLSILHIKSSHVILVAFFIVCTQLPLLLVLSCFFRNSLLVDKSRKFKQPRRRGIKRSNKVMDSYNVDAGINSDFETKHLGAMYYNTVLQEQISLYDLAVTSESKKTNFAVAWTFDLPYHVRTVASIATFLIIILGMLYIWWRSLSLPTDFMTAWMQLVCMAISFDIFVVSPVVALVQCCLSQVCKCWGTNYGYLFNINSTCLKNNKFHMAKSDDSVKALAVRHRARFIRYAQPLPTSELKKKKNKLGKKLKLKKVVKRVILGVGLLVMCGVIISQEKIHDVAEARTFVRKKLLVDNLTNVITRTEFWSWSEAILPNFISYENWHWSFDNIKRQHTFALRTIGVVLMDRRIGGVIESTPIFGNKSAIVAMLQKMKIEDYFSEQVDLVTFKTNVMSIFNGNPMYSSVKISFKQQPTGILINTEDVQTVYANFTDTKEKICVIICQLLLGLILWIIIFDIYHKSLETSWSGLLHFTTILNTVLLICGTIVSLSSILEFVCGYYLQDILDSMEFDDHESHDIYVNILNLVLFKQFIHHTKAILFFTVAVKSLALFKLCSVTYMLLKVMKDASKKVASYMVFILILILGSSHAWYLLCLTRSDIYKSFGDAFKYVCFQLPHLRLTTQDINSELSSFYILLSTFTSVLVWLAVKMSCIFFFGLVTRHKKKLAGKKIITFSWMLRKGWILLGGWRSLKKFLRKKRKTKHSKIPKKHIFEEIDYQLEEMLYRVNKLVERNDDCSDDEFEKSCIESSSYFTDEPSTSAGTTTNNSSSTPNVKQPLNTSLRRTKNSLQRDELVDQNRHEKSAESDKVLSLSRNQDKNILQPKLSDLYPLKHQPNILMDERNSNAVTFKRFSLTSIMQCSTNNTALNSPAKQMHPKIDEGREFSRIKMVPRENNEDNYISSIRKSLERLETSVKTISPQESQNRLEDIKQQKEIYRDLKLHEDTKTEEVKQTQRPSSSINDSGLDSINSSINMLSGSDNNDQFDFDNHLKFELDRSLNQLKMSEDMLESGRRQAEIYRKLKKIRSTRCDIPEK